MTSSMWTTRFLTTTTNSNDSVPDTDIEKSCSEYYQNMTTFIIKDYEGIPENLIINLCAWIGLLVLFTFIRRIGDYGRFGLLKQDDERWASKFFAYNSFDDGFVAVNENNAVTQQIPEQINASNLEANVPELTPNPTEIDNSHLGQDRKFSRTLSNIAQDYPHSKEYEDKYFFSWFIHMYKLTDEHIQEKSGKDALNYLVFQRYLILYVFIVTILTLVILLPINIVGGTAISDSKLFSRTTISNVSPGSSYLWAHLVLSWVFLVFGFFCMRQFSTKMAYTEGDYVSRTILITNYPSEKCKSNYLLKHFQEAYPDFVITDVQFAYDINKLSKLFKRKRAMEIGRLTSQKIFEKTGQRPMMHPFHFGSLVELCCCCCTHCFKESNQKVVDSIDFYTKNESELKTQIENCRERALKKPLGILFVTFEDQCMAAKFLKDYHLGVFTVPVKKLFSEKNRCTNCYICENLPRDSSLTKELRSDKWNVKYAASPSNLKWENISRYGFAWWTRVLLINVVLIILMIFFTTPAILLDKLTSWGDLMFDVKSIEKLVPNYLAEFLPSLVLRLVAALLPVLVALTALLELHWTRSAENRSMMVKTFTLLIFMVLILPTLGLTSIDAVFQWFKDNQNVKWRCVSDNGAFFIKYVTTCSFIGTALDLLRIPELLLYILRMMWSRSSAERQAVRMQAAFEFDYGIHYAWILTVFTVTLCFSVVCPLITPFGLVYLIMKHLVDRYNIFFAYVPTKVDKRIHKTAVSFCVASFIMLQFCILFFVGIRNKNADTNSMATVQTSIIVLSCIIFFGRLFFGFFKNCSPFNAHAEECMNDPSNAQSNYSEINNFGINRNSSSSNFSELRVTETDETQSGVQGMRKSESTASLEPSFTNYKPKLVKSKNSRNSQIASPFVPNMLRRSVKEFKLEDVKNQASSSSSSSSSPPPTQRPTSSESSTKSNGALQPIRESDVELVVENKANSVRSSSISRLHGALQKATSFLKKNKDASIFENSQVEEDDQVGITNRGFHEDDN